MSVNKNVVSSGMNWWPVHSVPGRYLEIDSSDTDSKWFKLLTLINLSQSQRAFFNICCSAQSLPNWAQNNRFCQSEASPHVDVIDFKKKKKNVPVFVVRFHPPLTSVKFGLCTLGSICAVCYAVRRRTRVWMCVLVMSHWSSLFSSLS